MYEAIVVDCATYIAAALTACAMVVGAMWQNFRVLQGCQLTALPCGNRFFVESPCDAVAYQSSCWQWNSQLRAPKSLVALSKSQDEYNALTISCS
jgi:hypothetical protein